MDILNEIDTIKDYLKKSIVDTTCEVELIYGSNPYKDPMDKEMFLRVLHFLRDEYDFVEETNSVDTRLQYIKYNKQGIGNIRCSVNGMDSIKRLCKYNSLDDLDVSYIQKENYGSRMMYPSIVNEDYNCRLNIKSEKILDESNYNILKMKEDWSSSLKYFRYKKRYSFVSSDKLFRIDLTAVKSNDYNFTTKKYNLYKDIKSSRILHNKERYELEIEYIGSQSDENGRVEIDKIVSNLDIQLQPKPNLLQGSIYSESSYKDDDIPGGYPLSPRYGEGEYESKDMSDYIYPDTPYDNSELYNTIVNVNPDYWDKIDQYNLLVLLEQNNKLLMYRGWSYLDDTLFSEEEFQDLQQLKLPVTTQYVIVDIVPPFSQREIKEEYTILLHSNSIVIPVDYTDITINPLQMSQLNDNSSIWNQSGGGELPSWIPKKALVKKMNETSEKRIDSKVLDYLMNVLNSTIYKLLCVMKETRLLLSKTQQDMILDEYNQVTEMKKFSFMAPQPVSLMRRDIDINNSHSILQGYVVTEKADGDRAQLIILKNKHGYLVTPTKKIIDTGLQFNNIDGIWIFDGEWITRNKENQKIELFMIFDVYWAGDGATSGLTYPSHAYTFPWLSKKKKDISRSSIIEDFKRIVTIESLVDDSIRVGFKTYLEGPRKLTKKKDSGQYINPLGICKMAKKILMSSDPKKGGFEYKTDGLIFLPMYLSVKSTNIGEVENYIRGTWSYNYKWKPPEENTIDFKVKVVKDGLYDKITTSIIDGKVTQCKELQLIVNIDTNSRYYHYEKEKYINYAWRILTEDYKKLPKESYFKPDNCNIPDIHMTNIITLNQKMICHKDKREIMEGMIIEMRYSPETEKDGIRWIPLRVRDDKTIPQAAWVANNIWNTIMNPVTHDMITGSVVHKKIQEQIKEEYKEKEYYVVPSISRDTESMNPLRDAHNYIKNRLITDMLSINVNHPLLIMDTSIGRGGDIRKYLSSKQKIGFIVGLDISSNIHESCWRYYQMKQSKPPALMIQYDTSKNIKDGSGLEGSDERKEQNHILLDIIYNKKKRIPNEYKLLRDSLAGIATQGFDLISSQFSIHYYFKNEITLRGYLYNLRENCRKGGYFIGTCYDGMAVYNLLNEKNKIEDKDEFGISMFKVEKNYSLDDFTYDPTNNENMFGNEINVYMSSIGQEIPEYLVNFEFFVDIMKEYKFKLVKPKLHGKNSGIFNNDKFITYDGFGSFQMILDEIDELSQRDPRLKKYYGDSLRITQEKYKHVYELSSLHNWFIFQRI